MLCNGDITVSSDLPDSMGNRAERTDSIDDYRLNHLQEKLDVGFILLLIPQAKKLLVYIRCVVIGHTHYIIKE